MIQRIKFLLRTALFWMLFFSISRFLFLIYQWDIATNYEGKELLTAFLSGLRHDASLTGYILMLTGLIISATFFLHGKKLKPFFMTLFSLIGFVFLLISVPNLELYRNWGYHIDATVLSYLKTPKEAMASTTLGVYLLQAIIFVIIFGATFFGLKRFVVSALNPVKPIKIIWLPVLLFITAIWFLPMRGSLGTSTMNVGFVYFSKYPFVNHLAVNPIWNFAYSLKKIDKNKVTFQYMDDEKANNVIKTIKKQYSPNRLEVLEAKQPNVLILILESFTSKATGLIPDGGNATPNLDSLAKNGLYFSNFYGIGDRSKIGIVGILSGYPSLPKRSVISYASKVEKLPSLCRKFSERAYSSTFYYGGDIRFANMNLYVKAMGFDKIVSEENFSSNLKDAKWGIPDEYVFDYLFEDIKNSKQPFFKTFFTLSSHEPFDVPIKHFKGDSEDERFLNSVYYTDKCLGKFINRLKKTDKWENTLIIMVADHGTRYLRQSQPTDFIKYQIPMVWSGGVLQQKGLIIDKIACQTDIANTLLNQLGWGSDAFIMGKDLLQNNQAGYAYFDYNNGFGYIDEHQRSVYDLTAKQYAHREGKAFDDTYWKAILQYLDNDFNKR